MQDSPHGVGYTVEVCQLDTCQQNGRPSEVRHDVNPYQSRFHASTRRIELFVVILVPTKLDGDPHEHQRDQCKKDAKAAHNHCIYKQSTEVFETSSAILVLQCKFESS